MIFLVETDPSAGFFLSADWLTNSADFFSSADWPTNYT
jgi:hypothetical protein